MYDFRDEAAIAAAGYSVTHDPAAQQFVLLYGAEPVGAAHYHLTDSVIDFDSTVVDPSLRGTGLSKFLAATALTKAPREGKRLATSCAFIARFVEQNPEFTTTT